MIKLWFEKLSGTKRDLLSLTGLLNFACKVVRPGRIFLRRMIKLSTTVMELKDIIELSDDAKLDMKWWNDFLHQWNGKAIMLRTVEAKVDVQIFTDASLIGMGGIKNKQWFSVNWPEGWSNMHINVLELFAVATAIIMWLDKYYNCNVLIYTDNKPIVDIWMTGSTHNKQMMIIIRYCSTFLQRGTLISNCNTFSVTKI